ncbi:MAG: exopolysaccharide biosynthesis polyprenyl glycosylphosphotransferase [Actinobacteria bacterium]|nr:exopolysaccharide biosynthesis polyprenyl glycosylphosphotransferase [Actinomycetota bacterium]
MDRSRDEWRTGREFAILGRGGSDDRAIAPGTRVPVTQTEAVPAFPIRKRAHRQSSFRIALRVLADGMAVSSALFLATALRFEIFSGAPGKVDGALIDYTLVTVIATPVWLLLFWLYGLYEPRQVLSPVNEFKQVFHGVVAGSVLIFVADSVFNRNLARGWALLGMALSFVLVGGERLVVRKFLHFMRRRGSDATRTLIVGTNHEARTIAKTLDREGWLGYQILGFVDDAGPDSEELEDGYTVLGTLAQLKDLVDEYRVNNVLIAASALDPGYLNRLFWELQDHDVDIQITSGTVDLMASRMIVQSVAGVPLLYVRRSGMDGLQRTIKRSIDVAGSLFVGLLLSPVLLAFALWIKRDSHGPAFFKQVRAGRDGEPFVCWKFRTMVADAEERKAELEALNEGPGLLFKVKEDPRITKAGKFLRRFSLDELPQLRNVLKGEMSLVGPRPALPSEVEQFDDWTRNRMKVKPGMTGLWQVSGRAETSFSDYVRYDLFYIQNWSLSLDLWILWRTFRAVLSAEGAH